MRFWQESAGTGAVLCSSGAKTLAKTRDSSFRRGSSYVLNVGAEGEHFRLAMDDWSRGSQLDLFVTADRRRCTLLPGFVRERELRALSIALRDGWPPPRRTPKEDPWLASVEPVVPKLTPLPGSRNLSNPVWMGRELYGVITQRGEQTSAGGAG